MRGADEEIVDLITLLLLSLAKEMECTRRGDTKPVVQVQQSRINDNDNVRNEAGSMWQRSWGARPRPRSLDSPVFLVFCFSPHVFLRIPSPVSQLLFIVYQSVRCPDHPQKSRRTDGPKYGLFRLLTCIVAGGSAGAILHMLHLLHGAAWAAHATTTLSCARREKISESGSPAHSDDGWRSRRELYSWS